MEQRLYHGNVTPDGIADALLAAWDGGDTVAQALGAGDRVVVQIGQRTGGVFSDEPRQALTLDIERVPEGVHVTMGQQQWVKENNVQIFAGGLIGFLPFFFTFPLGHLFGSHQQIDQRLPVRIWETLDDYVTGQGATGPATGRTIRLATVGCPECGVANPVGAESCSACGSALSSPVSCPQCGQVNPLAARFCNHCGTPLSQPAPNATPSTGR